MPAGKYSPFFSPVSPALAVAEIWRMFPRMHEMALAESLLGVIREEMARHGAVTLKRVVLHHGALANVVPEALSLAFAVLSSGETGLAGAELNLVEIPLVLTCGGCGAEFRPEKGPAAGLAPCPACAEQLGHRVVSGKGVIIDSLEVE